MPTRKSNRNKFKFKFYSTEKLTSIILRLIKLYLRSTKTLTEAFLYA